MLATLLAQSFAGGDDVDRNLGDIGGILTDSGFDSRYSPAYTAQQRLAGIIFGLICFAVAGMVAESVSSEVSKFVDHNVPQGSVAAVGLDAIDVRFHLNDR